MKTTRIDAAAKTNPNHKTDALAARLRYTAMAGAAVMALAGGVVSPANAAVEVLDEVKVEEKKRARFADVARRFVTPDFVESRKHLAQTVQSLNEQAQSVEQANRNVATKRSLADAASKHLDKVSREEAQKWFFSRDEQRVKDAETAKSAAERALASAKNSLALERNAKKERVADAAKAALLDTLVHTKRDDALQFRVEMLKALEEGIAKDNEPGVLDNGSVIDPKHADLTGANSGNEDLSTITDPVDAGDTEKNAETTTETTTETGTGAEEEVKTTEPTESGNKDTGAIDGNVGTAADPDAEAETSAREEGTDESGSTGEMDDADADSHASQLAEDSREQPVDLAAQAMASGVVLTQMANAAQQNADLFRKGMQDRLSGDDAFMQPTDISSSANGISTWAQAMGAQTTGKSRGEVAGFSVRGAGMVAGIDVRKNNSRVGVAVGYGNATVDANGENSQNASSKVSTYSVGLYGAHEVDGWFANGGVSYSAHSIKSQRAAKLGGEVYGLSGKTSATTVGGFAQFGKHIVTPAVNIDPSITLKVSNTSVKGFTENGDAGLKVDGSNFNSARVGIGARLWKEFGDESRSITPSLRIAYERELAHAAPSMDVALANAANAGTMTVTGNKLGRDIVSAEAGIDVKFGKKLSIHGGVNGSVRQGQTQAGVAGSLKYIW